MDFDQLKSGLMALVGALLLIGVGTLVIFGFTGKSVIVLILALVAAAVYAWQTNEMLDSLFWASAVFVITAGVVIGIYLAMSDEYSRTIKTDGSIPLVSLEEVLEYPNASGFRFHDARVAVEQSVERKQKIYRKGDPDFSVLLVAAPVVSSKWEKDTPVHVWAVYQSSDPYEIHRHRTEEWTANHRGGMVLRNRSTREDYLDVIRSVQGISSVEQPVIITWEKVQERR